MHALRTWARSTRLRDGLACASVLLACHREPPSVTPPEPAPTIRPTEPSRAEGPCAGLDYCACVAAPACAPRFSEGCVCPCDFRCNESEPQCMCVCGGAKFVACEPADANDAAAPPAQP